jgi:hypothetical protein
MVEAEADQVPRNTRVRQITKPRIVGLFDR